MQRIGRQRWTVTVCAATVLWLTAAIAANAEHLWIYDVADSLVFYQTIYPEGNWQPYVDVLDRAKNGVDRADDQIVMVAMEELLTMLRAHAYGIPDPAARNLYRVAVAAHPLGVDLATSSIERPTEADRLMGLSVPERAPSERGLSCHEAGCDEVELQGPAR